MLNRSVGFVIDGNKCAGVSSITHTVRNILEWGFLGGGSRGGGMHGNIICQKLWLVSYHRLGRVAV